MDEFYSRSEALTGSEAMEKLRKIRVLLVGVGGVGSWCAECLVRTGLMHLTVMDGDTVQPSNINRQLPATRATMGMPKTEALKERLLAINPKAEIRDICTMYKVQGTKEDQVDLSAYDYIIDAIDDVAAKTDLILNATRMRVKIFSSMGAALRFDPTQVTTGELMSIQGDALAKAVRTRMKKLNLHPYRKVRCVYSTEQAQKTVSAPEGKETVKGSLMQVTAVFGCTLASLVVRDLLQPSA